MATNLLLVLCSCRKISERSALPTFPVTGKVVTNGDQVPVGGCVQFEPDGNGVEYTAIGLIEADGSFSLSTPYVDRVLPGATDGSHSVSVLLPLEGAGGGGIVRINDRFIVRPRENNFIINLPKAH